MTRLRPLAVCLLTALLLILMSPGFAQALTSDLRYEYNTDWRGTAAKIWTYPWSLQSPDGRHVSSVYVHADSGYRHVETGVTKNYGDTGARTFWQWNDSDLYPPGDPRANWDSGYGASVSTGVWIQSEANNLDMGGPGDDGDNWRMSWNGNVIKTIYIHMIAGKSFASSERLYVVDNAGDDNESSFNEAKKKNNSGSWSLWVDNRDYWNADPYYSWFLPSDSYFYLQEPGRP